MEYCIYILALTNLTITVTPITKPETTTGIARFESNYVIFHHIATKYTTVRTDFAECKLGQTDGRPVSGHCRPSVVIVD
jgi:hypothetical protein